eukprot:362560-Chlamydomonas_euryale.AAC.1
MGGRVPFCKCSPACVSERCMVDPNFARVLTRPPAGRAPSHGHGSWEGGFREQSAWRRFFDVQGRDVASLARPLLGTLLNPDHPHES